MMFSFLLIFIIFLNLKILKPLEIDILEEKKNKKDSSSDTPSIKDSSSIRNFVSNITVQKIYLITICNELNATCSDLPAFCLNCQLFYNCTYGSEYETSCVPLPGVSCFSSPSGPRKLVDGLKFTKIVKCQYCHQILPSDAICQLSTDCYQPNVPKSFYIGWCYPPNDLICLGKRAFRRMLPCKWKSDKNYITSMLYSMFLGGFGADRFYLGLTDGGFGKLLSLGGFGVWSIIDFILIAIGYIRPPNGESYDD